jgi:CheY-like chemotaxis protein
LRRAVTRQLTDLGYQVREAEHAAVAIDILSGPERVDLLFSDLAMPGEIDGRELARRAAVLRPGLPILLTSGFAARGVHPGQDGETDGPPLLTKPYSRDQLAGTLREMLRPSAMSAFE